MGHWAAGVVFLGIVLFCVYRLFRMDGGAYLTDIDQYEKLIKDKTVIDIHADGYHNDTLGILHAYNNGYVRYRGLIFAPDDPIFINNENLVLSRRVYICRGPFPKVFRVRGWLVADFKPNKRVISYIDAPSPKGHIPCRKYNLHVVSG